MVEETAVFCKIGGWFMEENTNLDLAGLRERVRSHLFEHLLPFWCGPAVDHDRGGWHSWMSNDLQPDRSQPRGLIVNSRILWAFSAACRFQPDATLERMAERAFEVVMSQFWDVTHGGAFWRLADDGRVIDDCKKTYGQAFYIYALAEHFQTFGIQAARERAWALFDLIETHAHDAKHGGYWEVLNRDWSETADTRLSEKDANEKKSMNNHLHVLEAYTNLHRVWPDPRVTARLRELIRLFQEPILDVSSAHLHHFFNESWRVRSDTCTFGHDIEASWLLCEAAEVLGDNPLLKQLERLAVRMAEAVLREGLDPDGGLCYEGRNGTVIDAGKECWPQAEAVVGFLNAFQISGDPRYLQAAHAVWNYIENHLMDRHHGEWFWRIKPDGTIDQTLPKVSEWKGPYHGTRACLEAIRRLDQLSSQTHST